jgi:hypothetical protein
MCEFCSWIEKKGRTKQILFLTTPLIDSEKGKKLLAGLPQDDLIGHGAIRRFFGLEQDDGTNHECTDFSNPSNFPAVIVRAIKRGEMRGMAMPVGLLTATAWKAYLEAMAPAGKAYQEAKATARKAYQEAKAPAGKAYQEAKATAGKAYQEAKATAFWDLFANTENRNPAWR